MRKDAVAVGLKPEGDQLFVVGAGELGEVEDVGGDLLDFAVRAQCKEHLVGVANISHL